MANRDAQVKSKRRIRLALFLMTISAAVVMLLHQPILCGLGNELIHEDPFGNYDSVFVLSGDRDYAVAAELFKKEQVKKLILLKGPLPPLVRAGIADSSEAIKKRELRKLGVPADSIIAIPNEIAHDWEFADQLQKWLGSHPKERVVVIARLFTTRKLRIILENTLTDTQLSRVGFYAIRDRRFNESNWWRTRTGIKDFVNSAISQLHVIVVGRPQPFLMPEWSREALEQQLRSSTQRAP